MIELTGIIEVSCLNCGKPVAVAITKQNEYVELDEESLVVYNQTLTNSTGFVGVCSFCLSHQLSIRRYISGIKYYSCGGRVNGRLCTNTLITLFSAYGKRKEFGGRVVFEPGIKQLLYDVLKTKCNSCLRASRPLAQLKRLVQQFVSALHEPNVRTPKA